ncbi:hypothetical protein EAF00_007793 [Botryotinia globosa]|nr:hypothetical protein EAF00_007793 [Botryotinia globosa]
MSCTTILFQNDFCSSYPFCSRPVYLLLQVSFSFPLFIFSFSFCLPDTLVCNLFASLFMYFWLFSNWCGGVRVWMDGDRVGWLIGLFQRCSRCLSLCVFPARGVAFVRIAIARNLGWVVACLLVFPFVILSPCSIDYLTGNGMNKRADCFTVR